VEGGTGGDCVFCNRLRLTSNGKLKPCLFNNIEFNIRELGFEKALELAAELKPECGSRNETDAFYNIGG
jgi:cyclic pyranopterin phosphate synthase